MFECRFDLEDQGKGHELFLKSSETSMLSRPQGISQTTTTTMTTLLICC